MRTTQSFEEKICSEEELVSSYVNMQIMEEYYKKSYFVKLPKMVRHIIEKFYQPEKGVIHFSHKFYDFISEKTGLTTHAIRENMVRIKNKKIIVPTRNELEFEVPIINDIGAVVDYDTIIHIKIFSTDSDKSKQIKEKIKLLINAINNNQELAIKDQQGQEHTFDVENFISNYEKK